MSNIIVCTLKLLLLHINLFIFSTFEVNMARRYKVSTNSIRDLNIEHFNDGKSIRNIAKLVKLSHSTVFAVIKCCKLLETVRKELK